MRILIMGGTRFVGRHLTQAALDAGHDVTLFHRGTTGADLFPQATHVLGDRNTDLDRLAGGSWDATIDVSAYLPRQVASLADALGGRGGHHVLVSSVSVYQAPLPSPFAEDAPLIELADPTVEEVTGETYGGLKVLCERAATAAHGDRLAIVRPTYVVGPHDHLERFTWWVRRVAAGGEVLAPGSPDAPLQVIDARDMAEWMLLLATTGGTGTFHAAHPAPPHTFADLLGAIAAAVAPPGTTITWVDTAFLLDAGVDAEALPFWSIDVADYDQDRADPSAARAAGLAPRPVGQSAREVHEAELASPTPASDKRLDPVREAELLAAWAARS
ncbi:2'-hydroxyisoflavone reductase [Allocatelliglobosispora scoriae]|uniref:2'-hydroxyisoflavone reductase n=1 Tax=Allocatelliglobosispora scoriae TaxID=643052 RepID=A0A841BZY0_9ACTN|nr:NAD-dependent epimerase/dehydratase family protein [Allocatelliglobosispora scoriae]MBB5873245.1 2'-hydroxyisoflavone reductase [Allocatelliglobosispora scoriae]